MSGNRKKEGWKGAWGLLVSMGLTAMMAGTGYASSDAYLLKEPEVEEAYSDTDTRKGTVALRCQVFQGFHGEVTAIFENTESGEEFSGSMGFSERYQKNEELPEGEYLLVSVSAVSDNREYDCIWEPAPITLAAGTVCVVQIEVEPGGVMHFPEVLETATPSQIAPDGEDDRIPVSEAAIMEPSEESETGKSTQGENVESAWPEKLLTVLGVLGLGGCIGWFIWLRKQRR